MSDLTTWTADELLLAKEETAARATTFLFDCRWDALPAVETAVRRFGVELAARQTIALMSE